MTQKSPALQEQIMVANSNLEAMKVDIDRVRMLMEIATAAHNFDGVMVAHSVRDAALDAILRLLRPAMVVQDDGQD